MEDDLRRLKLPKDKDPRELLAEISATEVQYKCKMTDSKKAAVILRAGAKDYSVIMTMTSSIALATMKQKATAKESIDEIHNQFHIGQNKTATEKKHQKLTDEDDSGHKISLAEVGHFKHRCYGYGKVENKRNDCPNKN